MFAKMHRVAAHCLRRAVHHPFNVQLHEGTLPRSKFEYYVKLDSSYLSISSKALQIISRRLTNKAHSDFVKTLSQSTLEYREKIHLRYLGKYDSHSFFTTPSLIKTKALNEYSMHLLKHAISSPQEAALASLLACYWIYAELGKSVVNYNAEHPYSNWISSYKCEDYLASVDSFIKLVDESGNQLSCPIQQAHMISAFVESTEYEIKLWDSVFEENQQLTESHIPICATTGAWSEGLSQPRVSL